eukprot:1159257-Pelagomonas_calceolata.AAC.7
MSLGALTTSCEGDQDARATQGLRGQPPTIHWVERQRVVHMVQGIGRVVSVLLPLWYETAQVLPSTQWCEQGCLHMSVPIRLQWNVKPTSVRTHPHLTPPTPIYTLSDRHTCFLTVLSLSLEY